MAELKDDRSERKTQRVFKSWKSLETTVQRHEKIGL
jgi:hypothetical protein